MTKHTPVTEIELKAHSTAPRVTEEALDANIKLVEFTVMAGVLTICVITLQNGFTVTGESACASPANFDKGIGERIAFENARNKILALMGYALKEQLHQDQQRLAGVAFTGEMPSYIGVKVVNAKPMTRGAYNELRGWLLPENENPADAGYLIEYTDRVENLVDGFQGYVSWSPASVFEAAYRLVSTPGPTETFLDRLKVEHAQVAGRMQKLQAFLGTSSFLELPSEQRHLLGAQLNFMEGYENVLKRRIDYVS